MNDQRRLYVLRHAKSSWENPAQDDHDRPLAPRGQRAVMALAAHIAASDIRPELVLCSSARRTIETLEGVGVAGEHRIDRRLYDLTCGELLEYLRQVPAGTGSVMVIGHNPTMQMLVLKLTGGTGPQVNGMAAQNLVDIERKFPTGALATLSFDCTWAELAAGAAKLETYVRPKALVYVAD
ncbi:MAG: SixA phosphatase family protein [Solirubrobacteraceae bacterium]